jgi:cytochrome P450 PksS
MIPYLFAAEVRANPHPYYAAIRAQDPVYGVTGHETGHTYWVMTRYEDCIRVLKDPRFGKEIKDHLPADLVSQFRPTEGPMVAIDRHLLNIDPPDHTRLRALVHKAFTPAMVEALKPRIAEIANNLLDTVEARGELDLISDFGFPLPIIVIAQLLGVPAEERDQFRAWTKQLLFGRDYEEISTAAMEFIMYMHELLDDRRADPKDDLLSALVSAKEEGRGLDQQELLSMIFLLLVAGHETTVNLIGNGTRALLENCDQMRKLQADPGLIRSAVEEMLRYNGPVETTTFRWAFEDIEFGGKTIRQGDVVLAGLIAANRDPEVFDDPDRFEITRDPNRHIAFGNGIHYCLGAPLARLEGAIAINTLLQRLPTLHVEQDALSRVEWNDSILLHGMKTLPVKF